METQIKNNDRSERNEKHKQEFEKWSKNKAIVPKRDGVPFVKGQMVSYTNGYGVKIKNLEVLGIDNNASINDRVVYLSMDCYWFPVKVDSLRIMVAEKQQNIRTMKQKQDVAIITTNSRFTADNRGILAFIAVNNTTKKFIPGGSDFIAELIRDRINYVMPDVMMKLVPEGIIVTGTSNGTGPASKLTESYFGDIVNITEDQAKFISGKYSARELQGLILGSEIVKSDKLTWETPHEQLTQRIKDVFNIEHSVVVNENVKQWDEKEKEKLREAFDRAGLIGTLSENELNYLTNINYHTVREVLECPKVEVKDELIFEKQKKSKRTSTLGKSKKKSTKRFRL